MTQPGYPPYGYPSLLPSDSEGYAGPARTVTTSRKPTRHGLHLVLSILTFGVWAITG